MRFETVTAHAFGPLAGSTLTLAPGLTVIWGPNEAGKSSWHAALYFGLCARRRGRGRPDRADQALIDRHRPWDGQRWEVASIVRLADGRRVELRHDLAGLVACRATDLALGRDCSHEILESNDAPDGARWLGLDRRSFLAVACVRQADLVAIRGNAALLQQHIQRAAATGGTDETAAAALGRLEAFRRSHVGAAQSNAIGPLRRATDAVGVARAGLDAARRAHAEYVGLAARADSLERDARVADAALRRARARQAGAEAAALRRRFERARVLAASVSDGQPPDATVDDRLAQDVAASLRAWDDRPPIPVLDGPSADELTAQLAALPGPPGGDLEPHETVLAARDQFNAAVAAFNQHERSRPAGAGPVPFSGAGEQELRDLADALQLVEEDVGSALEQRLAAARARVQSAARPGGRTLPLAAGAGLAGLGVVLSVLGLVLPSARALGVVGLGLLLLGGAAVVWALARQGGAEHARALEELRAAEATLGARRFAIDDVRRRRESAVRRARELGLAPGPAVLARRADELRAATLADRDLRRWQEQHAPLRQAGERAYARLVGALEARGVAVREGAVAALRTYQEACRQRAGQAALVARRSDIERRIADRLAAERAAADAARRVRAAAAAVQGVARRCGIPDASPRDLVEHLRAWQRARAATLTDHDARRRAWAELQALLGSGTLADLEREVRARERAVVGLAADLGQSDRAADVTAPAADTSRLEHEAHTTLAAATRARSEAEQRASMQPSVPEAEEALAAAEADLTRVKALAETLDRTKQFLEAAEQHVHRDVAPALNQVVERWLPRVTGGRYTRALIDPETLGVRVAGPSGAWRDAPLLSHGTAEQVYLLLRVALAERLTARGEVCPLILDDATANCDAGRTRAILETLRSLSRERQVILFSHEDHVLAWAEAQLTGPEDRLVRLSGPVGAA